MKPHHASVAFANVGASIVLANGEGGGGGGGLRTPPLFLKPCKRALRLYDSLALPPPLPQTPLF